MSSLTGGAFITFEKPYLTMVADKIKKGHKIKFEDGKSYKVIKTPDVKAFIKAVTDKNETKISSLLRSGTSYNPIFNGFRWTQINKDQFIQPLSSGSEATKKQELASLFAIQKSIENNGYTNKKTFLKLYRDQLKKIYPELNEAWENSIFQQQLVVYKQVGSTRFNHYSRDDGFMKYITDLVRNLYGISRKDTWSPADVWLVSDYRSVKTQLNQAIRDDTTSLEEFNAILRSMFHDKKIIGISLKFVTGGNSKWEVVNLEGDDIFDNDEYVFKFKSAELNLKLKTGNEFINTDSKIDIQSKNQNIKFQIRQDRTGFNNLKIEGTDISSPGARLGKAPLDLVSNVFRQHGIDAVQWRRWRNFPTTEEEYEKQRPIHEKRFMDLKRTNKVDLGGVTTKEQFSQNMINVFKDGSADVANSKLIQLYFLNQIFSLSNNKLNNMMTNMAFLTQRKGSVFGPFAKVY